VYAAALVEALDLEAPEGMAEVIFSEPPQKGPTEEEIKEFAAGLRRRFPDASRDIVVHLARLWAVYQVGGRNGMSFKHTKSQLCSASLKLLGMIVERGGVGPDPSRIKALVEWPAPRTKGQLREFFGSINWVRPFLGMAFAGASHDLRMLLKKQVPDDFGELSEAQKTSFERLKKLAGEYTMLPVPDYEAARDWEKTGRPFEIFIDASLYGIGAMLAQVGGLRRVHAGVWRLLHSAVDRPQEQRPHQLDAARRLR
jgi:hypothetical protein